MQIEAGFRSSWFKAGITIAGFLLALPGMLVAFGLLCITLILAIDGDPEAIAAGLVGFSLGAVTLGAGGAAGWHGLRLLQKQPSKPIYLPPIWLPAGIFALLIMVGLFISENNVAPGLLFPPILLVAAALPPLLAVLWFARQKAGGLTWRRGLLALAGGATIGVVVALVLEILFPAIILALVFGLSDIVIDQVEALFSALAGENIAAALTNPGFIYIFIQVALIAPVAEELAKPLVTLPLLGRLSRRDAFLVGAMAGAGFAALENIIYAGFGLPFWAGILLIRAMGGAIHPLGSGLVALGWHDVLSGQANGWLRWLTRFGLAAGMHALWNGGSLLVITLAGAQFFGQLPPEINVLGLSAAGTTLALLIVLGLAALWLGHTTANAGQAASSPLSFTVSNRAVAIWALACLVAIVPAGITSLQLLVR